MTSIKRISFFALFAISAFTLAACDSNSSDPTPPGIDGNMLQVEGGRGTTASIPLTFTAEAGIKQVTLSVDNGAQETLAITSGATAANYTHEFEIPGTSTLGTVHKLDFTLTDNDDVTSTVSAMVTVAKLIDTPATYAFTRNGETSVSYSGQTDRLNQLGEIKDYLKTGDGGAALSEQVLLDMFANTGDNGGGNFSFSSTKQLKSKTFVPDLDNNLFEDLFAAAATASAAGTQAANGTAGLITRESKGSTILVNEKGHEFTQFIEKGLMGAVFYNQIYNTYLTDDRIGDSVENVEVDTGKNYTAKEHHWDEAFGYWAPPLDFSSNWPSDRASEDRFWSHYSNTVDNVNNGQLGTNSIIMNAFKEGRTAIVNNDPAALNEQRDILYDNLELVAAATAVHYLNDSIESLGAGNTGDAFHVMSEVWAFVNALRYSPQRKIDLAVIDEILNTDLGADGNFWNATAIGLNTAKSKLVSAYPTLAPVQDDL